MTAPPDGWTRTTLGDLGRYLNGRAFKKDEWKSSGRPIIRIQNLTGSSDRFNYFQGDVEDRYVVRPGDLLVSWAATLGSYFWHGPEAVLNQHIFKVDSKIDVRFHKHLLDHKLAELMQRTHGSGMVHITRGQFDGLPVDIPPLDEQNRVVELLEDHLSRIDAAADYLNAAAKRAIAWEASVLDGAVWGRGGSVRRVSDLLREPMRNGRSDRAVQGDQPGTRALTLTAVTRGEFTDEFTKMTSTPPEVAASLWLEPGDIFIQRSNTPELVGTAARYDGPRDWAIFPDLLIRVRADEAVIDGRYLVAALRSERTHRSLRAKAKGLAGSMPKIDQSAVGGTEIPVPDRETQERIVAQLESVFDGRRALTADLTRQARKAAALRRAVLAAAFSGRLTASTPAGAIA